MGFAEHDLGTQVYRHENLHERSFLLISNNNILKEQLRRQSSSDL